MDVLEEFNPWWFTSRVPQELLEEFKRDAFASLSKSMAKRQITAVTGLRRVGKTTLIYQLIQSLLEKGVDKNSILYFSFDERAGTLREVMNAFRVVAKGDFRGKKFFVFLDEVQKLSGWQDQVKKYYDLYPSLHFVVSGSEGLFVGTKSRESLAGRVNEFVLSSFSFSEFLALREKSLGKKIQTPFEVSSLFSDYLARGGFPEIANEPDFNEVRRYVRSSVVETILYKDLLRTAGLKDFELLRTLLELFASNPGMTVDFQSLSQQFNRDRRTITSYVNWLAKGFLIKFLANYRGKGKAASLRKNRKCFIADNGVITAFKPKTDSAFTGKLAENAVVNALNARFFWKNSHEVDAVVNATPFEVKYQTKIVSKDLRGVRAFMKKHGVKKAFVASKSEEYNVKTKEGTVRVVPAWKLLLKKSASSAIGKQ
ncbi:MAG: ATP-binding protein [Candidatus Micrarchaeia archaeon]